MSTKDLRVPVAIIGGGSNSAVGKAHLSALHMDWRWQVIAAVTSSHDSLSNWPTSLSSSTRLFSNIDEMLLYAKGKAAFVIILSPSPDHHSHAMKVLQHGLNAIIEKPIGMTLEEVSEIRAQAKLSKLHVYGIQNYTGFPMVQAMRALSLESIGTILHVRAQMLQESYVRQFMGEIPAPQGWRLKDPKIPMVIQDLGTHLFHLGAFVSGNSPDDVFGFFGRESSELGVRTSFVAIGRNDSGVVFDYLLGKSFLGESNSLSLSVYGTEGALSWRLQDPDRLKQVTSSGDVLIRDRAWIEGKFHGLTGLSRFKSGHPSGFIEALANYYSFILDDFLGEEGQNAPVSDVEDVEHYMKVIDAAVKSAETIKVTHVVD